MNNIKKRDMAARAAAASSSSPNLGDRFAHARAVGGTSPAARQDIQVGDEVALPQSEAPKEVPVSHGQEMVSPLREVDLHLIDPNPFNARKIYRAARIAELAASIGANGQDQPGIATIRNGRYVLVAGHYRFKALGKLSNRSKMLLLIRPELSDRQLYEMSFRENQEREDQTALDNALSWKELLEQGVYASETELAEATGISGPSINKTMAILQMHEQVLEIVREAPAKFGISVAYELALFGKVGTLEATIDIAKAVVAEEMSRKAIQEARQRVEKPQSPRKQKETSRAYKINRDGKEIGSLKTWDSGKVSLEVTLADPATRHELVTELQKRFGLSE